MSRPLVYAVNTTAQTPTTINFGNVVRRVCFNCNVVSGNLVLNGPGFYSIDTNIGFTGTAAGSTTIALYQDGTAIPGATVTLTTADAATYQVSVPCVVRLSCCGTSTITAVVTGTAIDITNAAIEAVKT